MTLPYPSTPVSPLVPSCDGDTGTTLETGRPSSTLQDAEPTFPGDSVGAGPSVVRGTTGGPVLDFYVFGRPAQQGSKSATMRGGRAVMFEDNQRTEPWRALVVSAARAAMPASYDRIPKAVGVGVSIAFTFDVPVSAPKRRRYWQTTRTSGDIDKLIRSTFDALTAAGVWHDDSQVVRLVEPFGKYNAGEAPEAMEIPGARIRIYRMGDQP